MLSEKQKQALSGNSFRALPRYIRMPLHMDNRVIALVTDVNSSVIKLNFLRSLQLLERYNDRNDIYHIRVDQNARVWLPTYEKLCCAYRALNSSRIFRRMKITGFRMVNFKSHVNSFDIVSDHYISGIDQTLVLLSSLCSLFLPSDRNTAVLIFTGDKRSLDYLPSSITSHDCWNGINWRLTSCRRDRRAIEIQISASNRTIVEAIGLAIDVGGQKFESLRFFSYGVSMDLDCDYDESRYREEDAAVKLSGYRIKRFQKIGQISKIPTI